MDHLSRIQRAIDYIENHLKDDLTTEAIAKEAYFSMWHFQKVFSSMVGDTLKEYVRKRRLTSALIELGSTNRRIIEIAVDYQFDSQESFTRAFKAVFGLPPGECRRQGIKSVHTLNKARITMEYLDHLYGGMTMQPKFMTTQEKKVVGLGTNFISILSPEKNNHVLIPQLWDQYIPRAREIGKRVGTWDLGLCEAIADKAKKKHPDECFYMACAEVTDFSQVPSGMLKKVIPAGRYAVFTHKGKLDKLEHTMNYIFGSWLPKSGEELRDAPDLEIYDQRFVVDSESSELYIYIPVK
ncbi:MAG: AraC family transcriptional regulator [Bdellovibrionota bacterium]